MQSLKISNDFKHKFGNGRPSCTTVYSYINCCFPLQSVHKKLFYVINIITIITKNSAIFLLKCTHTHVHLFVCNLSFYLYQIKEIVRPCWSNKLTLWELSLAHLWLQPAAPNYSKCWQAETVFQCHLVFIS